MTVSPSAVNAARSAAGLSSPPFVAPDARRLVGKALSFGAVRWSVRISQRSFSGYVLVCGFSCFARAFWFASRWGRACGFPLCVRLLRSRGSIVWAVSVPVELGRLRPKSRRNFSHGGWFVRRGHF